MKPKVFIDGKEGTTGLQIRDRLAARDDIDLLAIAPEKRKDMDERRRLLNAADVAILCLPDDAAKESVSLIDNDRTAVIDASTAHRVTPGWTTASMSSSWMATTCVISDRSTLMPPWVARMWPSSELPTPKGMIGTRCSRQRLTISTTSAVEWGHTTPSGSASGKWDSSWP